jgi:teichuronic acid biosynthesis protein TuaE
MKIITGISDSWGRLLLYASIGLSLVLFSALILKVGVVLAFALAITPLTFYLLIRFLERPLLAFLCVIIVNYLIMGLTRYIQGIPGGIVMDGLLALTFLFVLLRSRDGAVNWGGVQNLLVLLCGVWLVYCSLLFFNPETTPEYWFAGVRGLAVYLFLFPLLTAVLLNRYRHLKLFLIIWSVLTLLAVGKALMQKFIGFDPGELQWLHERGGSTHLIFSGARYFSFFTDAASFGSSMGFSMVVFSIVAFYVRSTPLRVYFLVVSLLAGYGLIISGTRAAMIIPFAGYAFFIVLSKQWKIIIPGIVVIACAFVFFKYTYIGQGNTEIRRMRSAFSATEDASYKLRLSNQAEMRLFMKDHPLGIGIGKAKRNEPGDHMYGLATDSSLVYIWVETGIVGLMLFLLIFVATFAKGSYDVWFNIRDNELRGLLSALLAGLAGMLACSYGNEMLQQFPNGPILYTCMAFIFMGRKFDREISNGTN